MPRIRFARSALPATLAAVALATTAACGATSAASTGKPEVIGAFYPLSWVASKIGGTQVRVTTLTKPGAEPHDLELTPRQTVGVSQAKLVLYIKELQPSVTDAVRQHATRASLDAGSLVATLPSPTGSGETTNGHAATYDPHIWLDPARMATIATAVGSRLATLDSAHAATYRANAKALTDSLAKLDNDYRSGLSQCRNKTIVTGHAAFGYLSQRYGLTQVPIAGIDPEAEPSPKRLAELTQLVRATGVSTIFTETLVSPKVAQTLAGETGARTATLDPIEGIAPGTHGDYLSLMTKNLQTLRTALGCS